MANKIRILLWWWWWWWCEQWIFASLIRYTLYSVWYLWLFFFYFRKCWNLWNAAQFLGITWNYCHLVLLTEDIFIYLFFYYYFFFWGGGGVMAVYYNNFQSYFIYLLLFFFLVGGRGIAMYYDHFVSVIFTFSAIRSIEKVLHLPKKSTSRFWWMFTFWGPLNPKKLFLACRLCVSVCLSVCLSVCPSVCVSVCGHHNSKNNWASSTKFGMWSYMIKISVGIAYEQNRPTGVTSALRG